MNCKKIQELLITDYIDGEMNAKMRKDILNHLATCNKCKQFEENLKQKAITPFKAADRQHPPDYIWENVKNRITKDEQTISEKIDITVMNKLSGIFKTLKPAFAVSAAAITILMIVLVVRFPLTGNGKLDTYIAEQAEFMVNLDSDESGVNGLGTSIEEYLLS